MIFIQGSQNLIRKCSSCKGHSCSLGELVLQAQCRILKRFFLQDFPIKQCPEERSRSIICDAPKEVCGRLCIFRDSVERWLIDECHVEIDKYRHFAFQPKVLFWDDLVKNYSINHVSPESLIAPLNDVLTNSNRQILHSMLSNTKLVLLLYLRTCYANSMLTFPE